MILYKYKNYFWISPTLKQQANNIYTKRFVFYKILKAIFYFI